VTNLFVTKNSKSQVSKVALENAILLLFLPIVVHIKVRD